MRESWQVDNISKILCSLQNFHPVNNSLSGLNYVTSRRFLLSVKQMAFSLSKYRKIEGPDHKHRSSPKIYLSLAKVLFQSFLFGNWVLPLQDLPLSISISTLWPASTSSGFLLLGLLFCLYNHGTLLAVNWDLTLLPSINIDGETNKLLSLVSHKKKLKRES